MSEFLTRSACRGRRPGSVSASRRVSRPDLIARLLRERDVARFLVAPEGYGKTHLACEYAEVVFSFSRVFWINGRSPCFLRDLDAGDMDACLLAAEPEPFLAVFEDVPPLGQQRADAFSQVVDKLLERGREVVVTCAPSADAYADLHRDRLRLSADDLLLTESEMALAHPPHTDASAWAVPLTRARRAACQGWGREGELRILEGLLREDLPADVLLAAFVLLALQQGSAGDVEAFAPAASPAWLQGIAESYPFLGLDSHGESYEAMEVPAAVLAERFASCFTALAARSTFPSRDSLAMRVADALAVAGEGERACALMRGLASREACARWLATRAADLMEGACVKPAHDLHAFAHRAGGELRDELAAVEAWRLVVLGDGDAALALARRQAFSAAGPVDARRAALEVVARLAEGEERSRAHRALDAPTPDDDREAVRPMGGLARACAAARRLADDPRGAEAVRVVAQRTAFRAAAVDHARRGGGRAPFLAACGSRSAEAAFAHEGADAPAPPSLHVRVFGGLSVSLGDAPVPAQLLSRQKTKALLAMLVLARGKELSRDFVVGDLWPDSSIEAARRNFYTVWSQLRRALDVQGSCPYLVRDQFCCRLNASLLVSDVAQLEETCRALMFGPLDATEWERLFAQVSESFTGDLLPNENDSDYLVRQRDEYRMRLVDALIAASGRLLDAGEARGGLWFAREALKRDRTREDAYTALMEAQLAGGQRTVALETYFACRRYLADELGIDPSPRAVQLYRDIIEAEEDIDW